MTIVAKTLYAQTPGTRLALDHDAVGIHQPDSAVLRVPLRSLAGIVAIGRVELSTPLLHRCGAAGIGVVLLDSRGRFRARLSGPLSGNVLLRVAQYRAVDDPSIATKIAVSMLAAKLKNSIRFIQRTYRTQPRQADATNQKLNDIRRSLQRSLMQLRHAETAQQIRGIEGYAARIHYEAIRLSLSTRSELGLGERSKHPPRSAFNAVMSFLYGLVRSRIEGALESVGLDPQAGFLHTLRPGRPALALDLMEEIRPIADRIAVTLVNRRQLRPSHFHVSEGGAYELTPTGRRAVITTFEQAMGREVRHRLLHQRMPFALVPHAQARVLARHLRGDIPAYVGYEQQER